jgi:hypothetical protein
VEIGRVRERSDLSKSPAADVEDMGDHAVATAEEGKLCAIR